MLLLPLLLLQAAAVNDAADALVGRLVAGTWGPPGSAEEATRLDLVQLATISATTPGALDSWVRYAITPTWRPITFPLAPFSLAGVRVTRRWVGATVSTIGIGLASAPISRFLSS